MHELTASDAAAFRSGKLTSLLVSVSGAEHEAEVGAATSIQTLRSHASLISQSRGPLHGVPIGVKDIIDTVDMPTTLMKDRPHAAWSPRAPPPSSWARR
jgi:Asp-tRNA(Asn)/Glu-tRNA(Gln) amidotransferase A subunit family amidase